MFLAREIPAPLLQNRVNTRWSKDLDEQQLRLGIQRLSKRIAEINSFDPSTVDNQRSTPALDALEAAIKDSLAKTFGDGSVEYNRYSAATRFDRGPYNAISVVPKERYQQSISNSRDRALALLSQAVKSLQENLDEIAEVSKESSDEISSKQPTSKKVFVVHGRDEAAKHSVARYLDQIGLDPVILHEQANKGRTIISKFVEEASGTDFAVVIMSPDDRGGMAGADVRPRARQNVVFELGFFIGALGANRVAALVLGDLEIPSDFDGVVYIPMTSGSWPIQLGKELRAAGYEIDLNKITSI